MVRIYLVCVVESCLFHCHFGKYVPLTLEMMTLFPSTFNNRVNRNVIFTKDNTVNPEILAVI